MLVESTIAIAALLIGLAYWLGTINGRHPGRIAGWWKRYILRKKDNNDSNVSPPA